MMAGGDYSGGDPAEGFHAAAQAMFALSPRIRHIAATRRIVHSSDRQDLTGLLADLEGVSVSRTIALENIVDRVGTGDAFAAGVVHGLVTGMDRAAIAIAVYVAFSGAVEQQFWTRIDAAGWLWLVGVTGLFVAFGHYGAWLLSAAVGLDRPNRITMLFAGAQKSIAMGAPMATVLFPPAVAGVILLPILLYHLVQLVIAAPIAARLRGGLAISVMPALPLPLARPWPVPARPPP